jgi:hypothetical protein
VASKQIRVRSFGPHAQLEEFYGSSPNAKQAKQSTLRVRGKATVRSQKMDSIFMVPKKRLGVSAMGKHTRPPTPAYGGQRPNLKGMAAKG